MSRCKYRSYRNLRGACASSSSWQAGSNNYRRSSPGRRERKRTIMKCVIVFERAKSANADSRRRDIASLSLVWPPCPCRRAGALVAGVGTARCSIRSSTHLYRNRTTVSRPDVIIDRRQNDRVARDTCNDWTNE